MFWQLTNSRVQRTFAPDFPAPRQGRGAAGETGGNVLTGLNYSRKSAAPIADAKTVDGARKARADGAQRNTAQAEQGQAGRERPDQNRTARVKPVKPSGAQASPINTDASRNKMIRMENAVSDRGPLDVKFVLAASFALWGVIILIFMGVFHFFGI